jgi:DNA-binding transcriptional LysR family regulator
VGLIDAGVGGAGVLRPYALAARRQVESGALNVLLPDWSSSKHPVCAAFPKSRNIPAKVRVFLEFAQSLIAE